MSLLIIKAKRFFPFVLKANTSKNTITLQLEFFFKKKSPFGDFQSII